MKNNTIHVCPICGGQNVSARGWININTRQAVDWIDDTEQFCDDCSSELSKTIEVPAPVLFWLNIPNLLQIAKEENNNDELEILFVRGDDHYAVVRFEYTNDANYIDYFVSRACGYRRMYESDYTAL